MDSSPVDMESAVKPRESPSKDSSSDKISERSFFSFPSLPSPKDKSARHLGLYHGVLIPNCETMWGVLVYLRFFYIVGHAGVLEALAILVVCLLSALLTALSLSAIATNGPIEYGGTYFLVSRALGPRIGGAVGMTYYVGLTLLASLEVLGGISVLFFTFPALKFAAAAMRVFGLVSLAGLACIVLLGFRFVSRLSIVTFTIVVLTMLSLFIGLFVAPHQNPPPQGLTGLSWTNLRNNLGPEYTKGVTFAEALSLFYPCFAGILSGTDRATSLKHPDTAIPRGTIGAILVSGVIYGAYFVLWGAVGTREFLRGELTKPSTVGGKAKLAGILEDVLWPMPRLSLIGVVIACLSMALQCLTTAPTILQAIAADGVIPFLTPFATQHRGEPMLAIALTLVVAIGAVMSDSVDLVAQLVSVSFLLCYAALNLSCFVFAFMRAPSWRPKWRYFHWSAALLGFLGCIAMMFVIRWYLALIALSTLVALYLYIDFRQVQVDWGTGLGGLRLHLALQSILSLGHEAQYSVNWRPQLLCLTKPQSRWISDGHHGEHLLALASQLKKGKGLCVVMVILEGKLTEHTIDAAREQGEMERQMDDTDLIGFASTLVAPSYREGKTYAIQTTGLGALAPNTLLLGWPTKWKEPGHEDAGEILLETLAECGAVGKAAVLAMNLNSFPSKDHREDGFIDVWWIVHDGGLLLLLAHLLQQHKVWKGCRLRVHTVAEELENAAAVRANLQKLLAQVRIDAEVDVWELDDADLAPYTYDYTLRAEEARSFAEEILAKRGRHPEILKSSSFTHPDYNAVDRGDDRRESKAPEPHTFLSEVGLVEGVVHPRRQSRASTTTRPEDEIRVDSTLSISTMQPEETKKDTSTAHNLPTAPTVTRVRWTSDIELVIPDSEKVADSAVRQRHSALKIVAFADEKDVPPAKAMGSPKKGDWVPNKEGEREVGEAKIVSVAQRTWSTFASTYTAGRLNELIYEKSAKGKLVILNLPDPFLGMKADEYLEYCEALTKGLSRVLLVHGTGKEIWLSPITRS